MSQIIDKTNHYCLKFIIMKYRKIDPNLNYNMLKKILIKCMKPNLITMKLFHHRIGKRTIKQYIADQTERTATPMMKHIEYITGSGFLRGTTSPANIFIFSARSGPNKNETMAETYSICVSFS